MGPRPAETSLTVAQEFFHWLLQPVQPLQATNCYANAPGQYYNQVWFFPRNSTPADILSGNPIPSTWGTPVAAFNMGSDCSPSHFFDMHLIINININLCGNWASTNVVQNAPGAYNDAFWRFKVYQYQF
ncbi:GPI anchored endo1,3(4)-beta-glucanase [Acanthamoeba castellanii str. Neff]|uniref:GPI anchored endo1,3(4)-beta-glucanase n=1 Tax=Acanthamoeba castellanii (strain ATCC 30010 / Neff) TaxID=1257118 RepID=L8HAC5_ACACF|nr:GPI anchored endo1,3(4)-beta-glucanase [Acanthamoeba castellanii str. Neff]ELR21653.1 GPI anchored endo1,3(4)-beta-glucanase [Acanthamoeba castellanii str. Neff]